MRWRAWLKFYRYVGRRENYLLLARAWQAARLTKRQLPSAASPPLKDAIAAVNALYLAPQPNWRISDPAKIYLFANWMIGVPVDWGLCVQRSLIVYRLLNGYGFPARLHFGIDRRDPALPGHAWVCLASAPSQAFGERENPLERFLPVFTSAWPL